MDVSSQLPELIRRPGITHWSPTVGRSIDTSHASWAAYIETIPEDKRAELKMLETHWPPSNVGTLNLERWYVDGIPLIMCTLTVACLCYPASGFTRIYKIRVDFSLQSWSAKRIIGHRTTNKEGEISPKHPPSCVY